MSKKTILIVEDNPILQELLAETLGNEFYTIVNTVSGEETLDKLSRLNPDLILMDIMLSGPLDGLETTRKIREEDDFCDIPVIIISSKGEKQDIQKGMSAGASDYMVKPYSPTKLLLQIEQLLD